MTRTPSISSSAAEPPMRLVTTVTRIPRETSERESSSACFSAPPMAGEKLCISIRTDLMLSMAIISIRYPVFGNR